MGDHRVGLTMKGGHNATHYNSAYHFVQGSVYKKANPRADINPETRDKFWDQQEVSLCD